MNLSQTSTETLSLNQTRIKFKQPMVLNLIERNRLAKGLAFKEMPGYLTARVDLPTLGTCLRRFRSAATKFNK